ncbi:MAG: aminoacyl-tRNA deacylase [Candidatus Paralactobacillus gallistercoris]|uniref:Cys-tRNA(Pro)/Cys-tRNA(Cys) deacylase n=1 Tax=Candidatus Paralactobacillus gallistercoris TaxID=2838724 RepID=A0A948X2H5_9LACO|nr:aminoacyl-tRNA deacylase [Candidatus Paralactobacillus gallistercoris]
MAKHKHDSEHLLEKTLVEKILDRNKISYQQFAFPTHMDGDVRSLVVDHLDVPENTIFKTLALQGKTTGPLIAVVPLTMHVDIKKLSHVSGNKKVAMVPLKQLVATTGYEHGANTPIGIHSTHPKYPIFIDQHAQQLGKILVSSGQIGRSVKIDAQALAKLVKAKFADIATDD